MKIKENKQKIIGIISFLVLTLVCLSLVNAENGCCFNPTNGLCSLNSEQSTCGAGVFILGDVLCTDGRCNPGCCMISGVGEMTTAQTCTINSKKAGVEYNFQYITADACTLLTKSQEKGACILGEYQDECKYTTRAQCASGNFKAGIFCCDASLNNSCKKTTKTICDSGDVYILDSCNQLCEKKQSCDYNSGFVCEKKNNKEANCKSINCDSIGKKNGESWCNNPEEALPGSRYFKQSCINGKVETEPCQDFREESCVPGENGSEATCVINPWQDCLAAGNDTELCDPAYCKMWPTDAPESESQEGDTSGPGTATVQTLSNGQGSEVTMTNGMAPDGHDYWYYYNSGYVYGGQISTTQADKGSLEKYFKDLHFETCLPLIQGGLKFYSSKKSGTTSSSANAVCSAGDYSATLYFDHDISCGHWRLKSWEDPNSYINGEDVWGNAGIIDMYDASWTLQSCEENGLAPLYQPIISAVSVGKGDASLLAKNLNSLVSSGVLPNPAVMRILQERCRLISDCGDKSSFVGTGGGSSYGEFHCRNAGGEGDHVICEFNFKCKSFKAGSEAVKGYSG